MDLSIFLEPSAWITLVTLIFLEIVLGVDNLVFIAVTTNRLPEEKQHIGRKLGLGGALVMRILFLSVASFIIHTMTEPLFQLDFGSLSHGVSVRDIILFFGGAYLIYKGISELRDVLRLTEIKAERGSKEDKLLHRLGLPQAILTIMVMDLVFSIDSVITAVGLADDLIIMVIAVMIAVIVMMIFIDPISNFINKHPEMKILALVFIVAIGVLLVLDGLGMHSGIEVLSMQAEKLMVYFAMIFAIILELIQMAFNKNLATWRKARWQEETADQVEAVREEMLEQLESDRKKYEAAEKGNKPQQGFTPVFIGSNVYIMMPVEGDDVASMKEFITQSNNNQKLFNAPIEIPVDEIVIETVESEAGADQKNTD